MKNNLNVLNSEETWVDEYGNTRMVEDIDCSKSNSFYFKIPEMELLAIKAEKERILEEKKNKIRNFSSDEIKGLMDLFSHIILYDTDIEKYLWDEEKLEQCLIEDLTIEFMMELNEKGALNLLIGDRPIQIVADAEKAASDKLIPGFLANFGHMNKAKE